LTTTSEVASKTRHSKITPEHLARTWNMGLDKAKETLRVTTQKGKKSVWVNVVVMEEAQFGVF
jgi:hypothetical protein